MNVRINLLRETLGRRRLSSLLVTSPPNIRYLCGFTGSSGWLLVTGSRASFITDGRYTTQAREEVSADEIRIARGSMAGELDKALARSGIRVLGVEGEHMTLAQADVIRRTTGRAVRPVNGCVAALRERKEQEEIRLLTRSARLAERAFLDIKPMIRVGAVEKDIAAALAAALKTRGESDLPFDPIVASGPRAALPHARPGKRKIRSGELVIVDWGGSYRGYRSDMTRTFVVGRPRGEAVLIYDIVHRAQRAAVKAVTPGSALRAVDRAARDVIRRAGKGEFFSHGTGHGIGIDVHESPSVSAQASGCLDTGMVITIEPGVYVPGFGGVRIEDMVAVTPQGGRRLTRLSRKLEMLP